MVGGKSRCVGRSGWGSERSDPGWKPFEWLPDVLSSTKYETGRETEPGTSQWCWPMTLTLALTQLLEAW